MSAKALKKVKAQREMDEKVPFLQLVLQYREVLFNKHSDKISTTSKREQWMDIHKHLEMMQIYLVPQGKDYSYLRDNVYRNIKTAVFSREVKRRQTGAEGMPLTELEQLVYEIEGGADSPAVAGLPTRETWPQSSDDSTDGRPADRPADDDMVMYSCSSDDSTERARPAATAQSALRYVAMSDAAASKAAGQSRRQLVFPAASSAPARAAPVASSSAAVTPLPSPAAYDEIDSDRQCSSAPPGGASAASSSSGGGAREAPARTPKRCRMRLAAGEDANVAEMKATKIDAEIDHIRLRNALLKEQIVGQKLQNRNWALLNEELELKLQKLRIRDD